MKPSPSRILTLALLAIGSLPLNNANQAAAQETVRRPPARSAGPAASPARPGERRVSVPDQLPTARFGVGDRVALRLTLTDRREFSLAAHRGKIVLLHFWMSTDLGKEQLAEVLSLHAKYADKGLAVVAVGGDHQLSDAETTAREMKLPWPLHWDGYWRDSKVYSLFGVPAVPRVAIIGPEGTLLYFVRGAKLAQELERAFLIHPPFAKDQVAVTVDALKEANRAMDEGDVLAGYRAYAALPPGSRNDPTVTKRAADLRQRLTGVVLDALKAVEEQVAQEHYVDAAQSLKAMAAALEGSPQQPQATKRLEALLAKPGVKEQIAKAERDAAPASALEAARALRDAGNDLGAYERFRAITMDYPETPAAGDALIATKVYDDDPIFLRKRRDAIAAPKAEAALRLAEGYRRAGRTELARKRFQEVIDRYPDTTFAEQAQKSLAQIPSQS